MPRARRIGFLFAAATFTMLWGTAGQAQEPSIAAVLPRAVKPGESIDVMLRGGNLAGANQLVTSFPCEAVLSPDVADNGTMSDQVVYRITVPAEVHLGIHALRVAAPGGVSAPKLLVVDDLPSVAQQADNTTPDNAQSLTLPIAMDGVVPNLSRSYYRFHAEAGQTVSIEVLGRRLGSALDPLIRLIDADGRELTYSDDEPGLSSDARIQHTFELAGDYTVEVRDLQYRGGDTFFYRLRIGDFPFVTVPYPMGAKRGSQVTLNFAGPNVADVEPVAVNVPADPLTDWITVGARRAGGQSSGFAVLAINDREEFLETEPNNTPEEANRVELGANINGRFEQPGDEDRYVFSAKKLQNFTFAAVTRRQGSPTDLHMRLLKPDGSQLGEADDTGGTDGVITVTIPDDGDYTLVVHDLNHRGGSEFAYRVEVHPTQTGFQLAADSDRLNIPAGGVASVTVTSTRQGYNGPISIAVVDLPDKVTSVPTVIGSGQNKVVLTIRSEADAPAAQSFPVRVLGTAKIGENEVQSTATITGALQGVLNGMPFPPRILSESVALAVAPRPNFVLRTEPPQVVFGKHLSTTFKVIAERQEGFTEEIALAVTPEKEGLPGGIAPALKPIAAGTNEIEVTVSGTDKAPMGEFTGVLIGTLKKDKATFTQPTPGIGLKVDEPFRLTVETGDAKLAKGGQLKIKARIERNPAFKGAVALAVENLPEGVTAEAAEIPADKAEVEITLSATQDAAVGKVENVSVKGTAKVGEATLAAAAPAATVTIE